MPTYLCHGFRWQRRSIRTYVILQNLDDASPDWIIPAKTSQYILQSFYDIFEFLPYCNPKQGHYSPAREVDSDDDTRANPKDRSQSRGRGRSGSQSTTNQSRSQSRAGQQQLLPPLPVATDDASSTTSEDDFSAQDWSAIKLLEEYDPHDLTAVSRPYAYVADYAVRIDLSCSIADEIARYEEQQLQSPNPAIGIPSRDSPAPSPGWFEELRDQLQNGEGLRWYVVVNNDEVREWPNRPSQPSIPRPEPGYQPYQGKPYKKQQQQPYQYQHQYQPQPGRAIPTLEQRHHHAQYLHQQRIFEGADQEKEQGHRQQQSLDRNDQDQQHQQHQQYQQQQPPPPPLQPQPLIFDKSEQQKKLEKEKRRQKLLFERSEQQRKHEEEKRQQRLLFEKSEQQRMREQQQQQQQALARKEQELRVERERQRQQRELEKEKEKEKERERQREWDRRLEEERERRARAQRAALLNGAADATANRDSKPPMVPAKDYNFPLPPTATTHRNGNGNGNGNASVPRLRPKMSLDAGFGRPKTPGSKGGGLRRLFGRGKVSVDGPYSP